MDPDKEEAARAAEARRLAAGDSNTPHQAPASTAPQADTTIESVEPDDEEDSEEELDDEEEPYSGVEEEEDEV
jgi:hypothetical protein